MLSSRKGDHQDNYFDGPDLREQRHFTRTWAMDSHCALIAAT